MWTSPADVDARYRSFVAAVAARQLDEWLPDEPIRVADISADPRAGDVVRRAGHRMVPCPGGLAGLAEASVDAVVAEHLPAELAITAELTFQQAARALAPGGRLYATLESLAAGLGELAEAGRWAELADASVADVLLVPDPEALVRRCFGLEEIQEMLADAGLAVDWVRPRTVLLPDTVSRVLAEHPDRLHQLVDTEVTLAANRQGEPSSRYLVVSASREPD
jgi:hypothetical protein